MNIVVKVYPNSNEQGVVDKGDFYRINLLNKPIHNKANIELIKVLESYFNKKVVKIIGKTSRKKLVILD